MTTTETKKELYRQKPLAHFRFIRMGNAYYYADLAKDRVEFCVPVTDMGEADFGPKMPGQELNRWIIED